ncbi:MULTISPECIES: hypothetical protein [unclassified Streptomyces]
MCDFPGGRSGRYRYLALGLRRAVLDWLDHRRSRWPNTANPTC